MPNKNAVILMGNLTREPEQKFLPNGTAVTRIGLAINRVWTQDGEKKEEVTWVDVTYFGKQAETIAQYCKKGHPIYVEARIRNERWTDKETGKEQHKTAFVGESFQFLAGKGDGAPRQEKSQEQAPARSSTQKPNPPPQRPHDPDLDMPTDDIPF